MTSRSHIWLTAILAIALIALLSVAGMLVFEHGLLQVRVSFAEEQTEIFDDMRAKALAASDPNRATQYLDYAVHYYPSGSKQETGSQLDRIVERHRTSVIRDILAHLKAKTGEDLGDDPRAWIEKYSPDSSAGWE
jgi:hypothetical protein